MLIREFYQGKIVMVNESAKLVEVASVMAQKDVGFVVVTRAETSVPVGVITDRDLVIRGVSKGLNFETTVGAIMTKTIFTVESNQTLTEAVDIINKNKIRRLLVLDHAGNAWSVISSDDILSYLTTQTDKVTRVFNAQNGEASRNHLSEYTRMA